MAVLPSIWILSWHLRSMSAVCMHAIRQMLMLPWSIKVFWAPVLDRFGITRFGHYRSWIIPLQFLTVLVLIGLSFLPIDGLNQPIYLWAFFVGLLSMNLLGATQDIATDGLAVNILKGEQQHWGNTFQVI